MNELFRYLVQSSVCLAALYMVYWLFLRKDTFFTINRIYLLLAGLFSLIIPLFSFQFTASGSMAPVMIFLEPVLITPEKIESLAASHLSWMEAIGIVYVTGVVIFSLRFLIQLFQLWLVIRRNGITRRENMRLIFVDKGYSPFSFFNMIFIREELSEDEQLEAILRHEQVHIRQYHSFDLILAEILTIVLWFNPFVWLLQRSLKSLHEFLADEGVMKFGFRMREYQQLIFDQTLGKQINNLTNNFNVSLIKQRIIMMTKSRSNAVARMKIVLALPAMLLALASFSSASAIYLTTPENSPLSGTTVSVEQPSAIQPSNAQKEDSVFTKVEKMPLFHGGNEELFSYLGKTIKYPAEAMKNGIEGTVFVTFVIEKDGSVTHVKILRGIGGGCDEESLRVVQSMPKWTPGYSEGKAVRVSFNLPIKYKLAKEKTPAETEKK
ncbi:MAG: M56 family metallopeptidase [Bacteroidales bacterium]|nr:M56 family metallopeptidase [Bacteroidales bacterium]